MSLYLSILYLKKDVSSLQNSKNNTTSNQLQILLTQNRQIQTQTNQFKQILYQNYNLLIQSNNHIHLYHYKDLNKYMIYKHSHLAEEITHNKIVHHISRQNPLCVILSKNFLSKTLENTLKIKKIPFIKKVVSNSTLMQLKLPLLMFQNTVLTQQQIVQFLADLWLGNLSFQQYIQRKQICLEIYNKWANLITQQSKGVPDNKICIIKGIKSRQDYYNYVFSGFVLLSSQIKGNLLQEVYDHYKRQQVNLQNLLVYDLITTVCNECQASYVDLILRGHFIPLLEIKLKIKGIIQKELQAKKQYEVHQIDILTDQKEQEKIENKNFSFNWKRFSIVFGFVSSIYYFWGSK